MKKKKIMLTENGKAALVAAPLSLFVFEVLARGGTIGMALAAASTFVAARHGSDIKNGASRLLEGLVSSRSRDEQHRPTPEEVRTHMREYDEGYGYDDAYDNDRSRRRGQEESDDFDIPQLRGGKFTFSELLKTSWRPSMNEIFLGMLPDGTNVFVSVEQLVHIALSGATRNGKTSLIRQLLSQLIFVGCDCILLDPHYTPYDVEIYEDWTPFAAKLKLDPMECKSYDRIAQVITRAGTTILEKRMRLRAASQPVGKPIFIVIDEYPSIVAKCGADIQRHIASLLREGGKYKIHLCIASQDFQVKTAFPDVGGALRDCFKTVLHVGGDIYTVKALLDMEKVNRNEEASLGKGRVYLRAETYKHAGLAYTPWMDNEAVFTLVGPSTYVRQAVDDVYQDDFENGVARKYARTSAQGTNPYPDELGEDDDPVLPRTEGLNNPMPEVAKRDTRRKAEDIDLSVAIALWNSGFNSRAKLAKALDIAENQAGKLMEMMKVTPSDGRMDG